MYSADLLPQGCQLGSASLLFRMRSALADFTLETRWWWGDRLIAAAMVVTDTDRMLRAAALNDDFLVNQDELLEAELLEAKPDTATNPPLPPLVGLGGWTTCSTADHGIDKF